MYDEKKILKDNETQKFNDYKKELEDKKELKKIKKKNAEIKKLEKECQSSSEDEIIVKKKKSLKIIYIKDDTPVEKKEPVNIVINNTTPLPTNNLVKKINTIQGFF